MPRLVDQEVGRFIIIGSIFMLVTCGGLIFTAVGYFRVCDTPHAYENTVFIAAAKCVGSWRAFRVGFLGKAFSCPSLGRAAHCSPCLNLSGRPGRGWSPGPLVSLRLSWVPGR